MVACGCEICFAVERCESGFAIRDNQVTIARGDEVGNSSDFDLRKVLRWPNIAEQLAVIQSLDQFVALQLAECRPGGVLELLKIQHDRTTFRPELRQHFVLEIERPQIRRVRLAGKQRPELAGPAELQIDVHQVVSNRRSGKQLASSREILWVKRQQRLGPITLVKNEMVSVFPGSVADIKHTTFVDLEIERFTNSGKKRLEITEVNDVAALLDCFAKLRVLPEVSISVVAQQIAQGREIRCNDGSVADERQVSNVFFNLPFRGEPPLFDRSDVQSVPFFVTNQRVSLKRWLFVFTWSGSGY